jgi:formate--tetrahydrofolate ligase
MEALEKGIANLEKHIENLHKYGVPVVVTLNAFVSDTDAEIEFVRKFCNDRNCEFALSRVWEKGGEGGIELANAVLNTLEKKESHFAPLYDLNLSIEEKITKIATQIYGAKDVAFSSSALKQIERLKKFGYDKLPICMAKNQYSLSDDPTLLGRPEGFTINIREVYVSAGAGFIVALTGTIMTLPGLPKNPAAYNIDVTNDGIITGLF